MKKMLCLLLCAVLLPVVALAEETAAAALEYQELFDWAQGYIDRAMTATPLNDPASSLTAEGYEFEYDFATLYADTPVLTEETSVSAVVVFSTEESTLRGVTIGSSMTDVLEVYYTENPELLGSYETAVLYAVDALPVQAQWGRVNRDGQRVQTIEYAVHEQLEGGKDYTNAGVIYTMAENRVSAVRVYGLDSCISLEEVNDVMYSAMLDALEQEYAMVPFSYNGAELTAFAREDLNFSGMDFLTVTAQEAINLLGEPVNDAWLENGEEGYIRVLTFDNCEMTFLYDSSKTQERVYMLHIAADGIEGPRAVRCGDTFSSVYSRFRFGEGEYQADDTEVLYGVENQGSFGHAAYGISDASATLRYGFTAPDGRQVVLQMGFTVMELTEIMLYAE